MLKQKLMGLALIILGAISAAITGDSTAAVLLYIIGLAAIFTKDYILTLDETKNPPETVAAVTDGRANNAHIILHTHIILHKKENVK